MEIISTLLPPLGGKVLMALDVLVDGKTLHVGFGQGQVVKGDAMLSQVGQLCFDRLAVHGRQQHPEGAVHLVELKRFNRAAKGMREVFATADEGDTVFFICADAAIYDAVFEQLNIKLRPGLMTPH